MNQRKLISELQTDECVICFEKMVTNLVVFKCKHSFHFGCAFKWLQEKNFCPLCKKVLLKN